jgi:hypothetical protein
MPAWVDPDRRQPVVPGPVWDPEEGWVREWVVVEAGEWGVEAEEWEVGEGEEWVVGEGWAEEGEEAWV